MHASTTPHDGGRGIALLLRHVDALDRLAEQRPSAFDRLAAELGVELARMLVSALSGEHGVRARSRIAA
jgi:hypothetical protein